MNGYFRLVNGEKMSALRLFPPKEGGRPVTINDVAEYLTMKNYACDLPAIKRAVETAQMVFWLVLCVNLTQAGVITRERSLP